jgi:hypothetical protein
MRHRGSNPLSIRQHLIEVTVAALTASTIAVITSWFGWPGTVGGVAFSAMVTTTIQAAYKGYVGKVAGAVNLAGRPAPPPLGPLADRPAPPPLGPLTDRPAPPPLGPASRARRLPRRIPASGALRWFSLQASPETRQWILSTGLQFGVVASIIGVGIVTVVELRLGGNFSCYFWANDCSPGGINPPPPSIVSAITSICQG